MRLFELLNNAGIAIAENLKDVEISSISQDTRAVKPGSLFACIVGARSDGHRFAQEAVDKGAVAVLVQRPTGMLNEIVVEDSRKAYSLLCKAFFNNPNEKLTLIAVTGTNGKTTITSLLKQVCEVNGHETALIGTIQNEISAVEIPARYTTPDPFELFALLARAHKAGCRYVVMEASSQALDQLRLYGLTFEVAVFSNLTQDHLDYHGTFDNYFAAKSMLFEMTKKAVLNLDDEYALRIAESFKGEISGYAIDNVTAEYRADKIELTARGVSFQYSHNEEKKECFVPMIGRFSVYNTLAVLTTANLLGLDLGLTIDALSKTKGVRGRSELLYAGEYSIICDYAHTDDGLKSFLSSIKPFVKSRLIVLFGCAGERDAKKRPGMARAVAQYADLTYVTSDNPRGEDADGIIADVLPCFEEMGKDYVAIVDRRYAINRALAELKEGDLLALCGKGHEDYQVVDGITLYLDEHKIVADYIDNKNMKGGERENVKDKIR